MEIENEQELSALVDNDLVAFVLERDVGLTSRVSIKEIWQSKCIPVGMTTNCVYFPSGSLQRRSCSNIGSVT